jgi:Asp-tRNA(Asn)/Glu-tRNA(Gln) amidotransferase A subunit family amidase
MGVPCVTVPVGSTAAGLPLGVQVIARLGDDARAIQAAHFVEMRMRG